MFAYRRKRSLGCEQLEGRFAPSSVMVGGGSRSALRDAHALETTQAEQAAFFLAASAAVSQSSSVANVAPITFDQPAAGEAERWQDSDSGVYPSPGFPMICDPPEGWGAHVRLCILVVGNVPPSTDDGTLSSVQPADESAVSAEHPSSNPSSTGTPSEQGDDAGAVGAEPFEEQPAGGDDVVAEDFSPVVDDTPVAGDEMAEPVVEDTGMPDAPNTEEMPRCGNDFEDLGPMYPVGTDTEYTDTEFTDADGSDQSAVDEVPVEWHSGDAADEAAPFDAL
jgi:hypothetical protein